MCTSSAAILVFPLPGGNTINPAPCRQTNRVFPRAFGSSQYFLCASFICAWLINPGNALKRYIRPAAKALGITLGGYHDFRHTLSTELRGSGVHPKVISDILGQKKVNLAMDVYDRTDVTDFAAPLAAVTKELVSTGIKPEAAV